MSREWTGRDRVNAALNFQEADRVPIHDSPWGTTIARWRREGLPENVGPDDYFGYEIMGYGADLSFRFPVETIEETEEYIIQRTANGAVVRNWKHRTSTPEMIDFLIKTPDDWEKYKHRLEFTPERVDLNAARAAMNRARETGRWFCYTAAFGYDKTQQIVGSENLLMAMIDYPDWVYDMFYTSCKMAVEALDFLLKNGIEFDGVWVFNDMGYRNAPLFSPDMYRRLQKPGDEMMNEYFHDKGFKVILHSCGNVRELVPDLIEAGFDCLQPLEVKAGMDLVELKRTFGDKLALMGGIDVRAMAAEDPSVIEEEIATKIPVAKEGGGYIYHSDHSVPDNVSFERYKYVIELVKKYGAYS